MTLLYIVWCHEHASLEYVRLDRAGGSCKGAVRWWIGLGWAGQAGGKAGWGQGKARLGSCIDRRLIFDDL